MGTEDLAKALCDLFRGNPPRLGEVDTFIDDIGFGTAEMFVRLNHVYGFGEDDWRLVNMVYSHVEQAHHIRARTSSVKTKVSATRKPERQHGLNGTL